jgi:hypothetical protein
MGMAKVIRLFVFLLAVLFPCTALSQPRPGLLVEESDGSPAGFVYKLKFSNGS